jgi:hypothetical protein
MHLGGASKQETDSGLFVYSTSPIMRVKENVNDDNDGDGDGSNSNGNGNGNENDNGNINNDNEDESENDANSNNENNNDDRDDTDVNNMYKQSWSNDLNSFQWKNITNLAQFPRIISQVHLFDIHTFIYIRFRTFHQSHFRLDRFCRADVFCRDLKSLMLHYTGQINFTLITPFIFNAF